MGNGDHKLQHMVVMQLSVGMIVVTNTDDSKQPAVYHDTAPAELRCAQMRTKYPELKFAVISFPVL